MLMSFGEYKEHLNEKLSAENLSELQKKYREYFRFMLDCYEIKSPAELSEEKKKKFFKNVKKYWDKGYGPSKSLDKIKEDICGKDKDEEKEK